jgi:glycosyltransferase involved in cell wall biosynthesis
MQAAGHRVTMLTSSALLREEELPSGRGLVRRGRIEELDCIVLDVPYHQTMSHARRIVSFLQFMAASWWVAMREPGVDLVYASSTPLTVGAVALAARLLRGSPFAFEARDLWPDAPMEMGLLEPGLLFRLMKAVERSIYHHASFLVAVNQDVGRRMLATLGRDKPLVIAPNACDVRLFRPDRDGSAFRDRYGLQGKLLCVHTGTMGHVNGLDAVLDAAIELKGDERLRFLLIGDGKEKPHLRRRVAEEGLDSVLILDGIPKTELADALATADIGLMTVRPIPVLEINCANKFFDYLAAGLPIVLNYRGWQARILDEHGCGLSAPQGDHEGFVAAIRRLAHDAELRATQGRNGRRLAEGDFSREKVVAPILQALGRSRSSLYGFSPIDEDKPR